MVPDASLLNTQHYKVWNKSKVEQSTERSRAPRYLGVVAIEKGVFRSPSITVANFTFTINCDIQVDFFSLKKLSRKLGIDLL